MTVHEPRTTSRPALRPELERCRVGDLEVLTLDGSLHLGVDLADATVLRELDGTSSIAALTARHGEAAAELIDELAEAGFLVGSPPFVAPSFEVSSLGVEFGGFDQLVARTDRLVGPILAATWFRLAALALLAAGPVAFVTQHRGPGLSGSTTLAVLVVWELVAIAAHEMAHGLVLHRGGRRVGRAGLGLHWGAITFFVDATDAFFLPRRRRVAQALAGPAADAMIAGALALLAALAPSPVSVVLLQMAVMGWISALINLSPVLELDGQHALADLFDIPDLHHRSLRALRSWFRGDRTQPALALYGAVALALGLVSVAAAVWLWTTVHLPVVVAAWHEGLLGRVAAVVFVGPTAAGLAATAVHHVRSLSRRTEGR